MGDIKPGLFIKGSETKNESRVGPKQQTHFFQPTASPIKQVLFLQKTLGNQVVQRLFTTGSAQTKSLASRITPLVQRQPVEEKEEEILQTKVASNQSPAGISNLENNIQSARTGGTHLPESLRIFFEPRFGHNFSRVRLHSGAAATQINTDLNSEACTHGDDIFFGAGRYSPGTPSGSRLIAHELTHIVQQKAESGIIDSFTVRRSNSHQATTGAGSIHRQAPRVQRPNIQNCTFRQLALVLIGITEGRRLVGEALRAVSGYRPRVQNKAHMHFGQPLGPSEYSTIIQRYRHILNTLNSKTYICDTCTPHSLSELEIQPPNPAHLPCAQAECPGSRIIICPPFGTPPGCPPPGQTIVHEAAHNSGARRDIDRRSGQYPPTPSDGINNAYSYEYFAADVSS